MPNRNDTAGRMYWCGSCLNTSSIAVNNVRNKRTQIACVSLATHCSTVWYLNRVGKCSMWPGSWCWWCYGATSNFILYSTLFLFSLSLSLSFSLSLSLALSQRLNTTRPFHSRCHTVWLVCAKKPLESIIRVASWNITLMNWQKRVIFFN